MERLFIATYLVEKYTAHCPVLLRDDTYVDEPAEVRQKIASYSGRMVDVPATRLEVHVPTTANGSSFRSSREATR